MGGADPQVHRRCIIRFILEGMRIVSRISARAFRCAAVFPLSTFFVVSRFFEIDTGISRSLKFMAMAYLLLGISQPFWRAAFTIPKLDLYC